MATADPGVLPGNLLTRADSSFETGTPTWIASNSNTVSVGVSSTQVYTGAKSLTFKATAAGTAQVQTGNAAPGPYKCVLGQPYIFSGYVYTPGSRQVLPFLAWDNNSGNLSESYGTTITTPGAGWWPIVCRGVAAAGANSFNACVYVSNASAGDVYYIDMLYAAQSDVQILVDWSNSAIGSSATAGNAFADITPWVRFDKPVNLTRGRQDSISAVQPAKANFTVDNNLGWFTPLKSTSPWFPGVQLGRRVQVNLPDETGMWWTRFDGQIASFAAVPAITGQQNLIQVSCADVLAFLNRGDAMSCWTVEQTSSLGPALQYIMNEPANSQGLRDSSGNNGPMLQLGLYSGMQYVPTEPTGYQGTVTSPTYAFQSGNNPVEGAVFPTTFNGNAVLNTSPVTSPLPSVQFGATINASATNLANTGCSAQFDGELPFALGTGPGEEFTIVAWVWPNVSLANLEYVDYAATALCLGNTRTGATLSVGAVPSTTGGNVDYYIQYYKNFLQSGTSITSQSNVALSQAQYNGPVMIAMTVDAGAATLTVGGNLYGAGVSTISSGVINLSLGSLSFNYLSIGGMLGGGLGWLGNVSLVNVYQSLLDSNTLTSLAQTGAIGSYGTASGQLIAGMVNDFTGIPSYWSPSGWDAGSNADYADITGQNVMSAVQSYESAEHGFVFTDSTGRVNLYDRSRRMGAAAPITPSQIVAKQAGFANGTGTSASIPVTFSSGLISADSASLVVVTVPAAATVSVSDSSNNSYTQLGAATGTGQITYVFASFGVSTLSANNGDHVVVSQSVSQAYECSLFMVPNVYAVDVVNTTSGTSATPSITTGTERGYYDFEFVVIANASSVGTNTTPSGWTHVTANSGSGTLRSDVFTHVSSTGFGSSDTCTPGYASSVAWSALSIAMMANTDVLPEGSYDASIAPKWNDQYLVNSEALQNERGGNGILAVNQPSIDAFGKYPNGSVQSPQTAPYLTIVGTETLRQNNTPGNSRQMWLYNTSNIQDAASWDVNTLGNPGMKLATVKCDMLANLPGHNEYVPPSNLYQQEIGQLIQLGTSLPWWPDQPNSGTLFIEGTTEVYSTAEKSITFYSSPSLQGVAWQPGSSLSGQLDTTAVIGISKGGPDTPQIGTPNFTPSMNLGAGANGYVGARDVRGLTQNLQNALTPPLAFMQQTQTAQNLTSGTPAQLVWDTTVFDTAGGYGLYIAPDYTIMLEGWYEFYLTANINHSGSAQVTAWIGQNQTGATRRISPVSAIHNNAASSLQTAITTSAVLYCYPGDAVCGYALQDSGSTVATSTSNGGSHMSVRYLGRGSSRN